jgi:hypothetical protein
MNREMNREAFIKAVGEAKYIYVYVQVGRVDALDIPVFASLLITIEQALSLVHDNDTIDVTISGDCLYTG